MMATEPETLHDAPERITDRSVNLRWAIGILVGIVMAVVVNYVSVLRSLETLATHQGYVADTLKNLAIRDEKLEERLRNVERLLYGRQPP